jgi:hypothetical protein
LQALPRREKRDLNVDGRFAATQVVQLQQSIHGATDLIDGSSRDADSGQAFAEPVVMQVS